jgi:hypothetical protein
MISCPSELIGHRQVKQLLSDESKSSAPPTRHTGSSLVTVDMKVDVMDCKEGGGGECGGADKGKAKANVDEQR